MKCVVCEKFLVGHFSLCDGCQTQYGRTAKDRPAWLNYLITQNVIETRNERETSNEFSLDYVEDIMTGYPEQHLTGIIREIYQNQVRPCEEEALDMITKVRYESFMEKKLSLFQDILDGKKDGMEDRFNFLIEEAQDMYFHENVRMLTKCRDTLLKEDL